MDQGHTAPHPAARLVLLGVCTGAFQTLFARQFLATFSGNEAVLAAFLGPWLALTAAGAVVGRSATSSRAVRWGLFLYGPLAVATWAAARVLPRTFPAASSPGVDAALAWAALLLAPTCMLSGAAFTWLARDDARGPGRAYLADSVGAALAGALLSLLALGHVVDQWLVAAVVLGSTAAVVLGTARRQAVVLGASGVLMAAAMGSLPLGSWTLRAQGAHLAQAEERASAQASVVVAREAGQVMVLVDRIPVATDFDPNAAEEAAHVPLSFHPSPRRVAVLGVPPVGALTEMARHGVQHVDVVLADGVLAALLREQFPDFRHPLVELVVQDERRFLEQHREGLDAVLVFSPEPSSAQLNRHFTAELMSLARGALRPGGLVSVALPAHAEQASHEKRRLHSSVARTMEAVLGAVRVLPAGQTFYLATGDRVLPSAASAATEITTTLAARGIVPVALTAPVLADRLSARRTTDAARWSALPEAVNHDLHPTTYRLALDRILAEFGDLGTGVLGMLAAALALVALLLFRPRSHPVQWAVFTSGAGGLGLQLVIMLAYQVASGALFRELGLMLSGFMAGAALGAWMAERAPGRRTVVVTDVLQAVVPMLLALLLPGLVAAGPPSRMVVFVGTLGVGLLPGLQFAAAGRLLTGTVRGTAGTLYAADLVGAAVAALATFTFVVPALGLPGACLALGALKLVSTVALLLPPVPVQAGLPGGRLAPALPILLVATVLLAAGERSQAPFYAATFWRPYQWVVVATLLLGLAVVLAPGDVSTRLPWLARPGAWVRGHLRVGGARLLHLLALLPVAAFPLGRCYFHVPFLMCHVCPRQCIFGVIRPYAVPVALIANLHDRRFCERMCPLGTVQTACERLRPTRALHVRALGVLRLLVLAAVVVAYFQASRDRGEGISGDGVYALLFKNDFAPSTWVLGGSLVLLLASFLVRRPFCGGWCPVGGATAVLGQVEKRLGRAPLPSPRENA